MIIKNRKKDRGKSHGRFFNFKVNTKEGAISLSVDFCMLQALSL